MSRVFALVLALAPLTGRASAQPVSPPATPLQSYPPAPPSADTCGASQLAGLVGQSRRDIPIPVDPSRRRVVCTTCPRTLEYRPDRLTIFYDAQTGRVVTLQCG